MLWSMAFVSITPVLAQARSASDVARLADAPAFSHYLFESPWIPAIVCIGLGLVAFAVLNARGRAGVGALCALIGLVLAGGVVTLAASIKTDRERIVELSEDLFDWAARGDTASMAPLLDDRVSVRVLGTQIAQDKAALLAAVEALRAGRWRVDADKTGAARAHAQLDSALAGRSQVRTTIVSEATKLPTPTIWMLSWQREREDQPWRLVGIESQFIAGLNAGAMGAGWARELKPVPR
jgi:hypothetical protein